MSLTPELKPAERSNKPDHKDLGQPPIYNRSQRRDQARIQAGRMIGSQKLAIEIIEVSNAYRQEIRQWNRILNDPTDPFGVASLYRPQDSKTVVSVAEHLRSLSVLIGRADNLKGEHTIRLHNKDKEDIYTCQIKSLSLAEIEKMPTPLSLDGIKRINKFFHCNRLSDLFMSFQAKIAQNIAVRLPVVSLANPEVKIPPPLKNLNRALTDYFDYYTSALNYPNAIDSTRLWMLCSAVFHSGILLFQGLGAFMPARLGITPASTLRLFEEQSLYYSMPFVWKMFRKRMEPLVKCAYREDSLPPECSQFQHYDGQAEKKVSAYLRDYVQQHSKTGGLDKNPGADDLLADMNHSINTLRAVALEQKDKFKRIPLEHPLFEAITLATQYKNSLIIAAQLKGVNLPLVLEVNGDKRLYGIPLDLLKENPHSGEILARDLFPPVLDLAYQRNPRLKPQPTVVIRTRVKVEAPPSEEELDALPEVDIEPEQPKVPKRRTLVIFTKSQELSPRPALSETQPQFTVLHTRSQIRELMGKGVSDKELDRVMAAIHRFELGNVNQAKILVESHQYTRLRVGDLRILLQNLGHGRYTVYDIPNRREAYRRLT